MKPRSLSSDFEASGDSGYAASVVVEASEDSRTRQVKRDRDGSDKAGDAEGSDEMDVDPTKARGDSSTEEVEEVKNEEEDEEEEQGSTRAQVTVVGDEARREVQEELEFHAKAWRLVHLGEGGELQPRGREPRPR